MLLFICLYFRNVYEILTQKEGANQYEACLMKGKANFHHYFGRNNPPPQKKFKNIKNKRRTVSTDVQSDQLLKVAFHNYDKKNSKQLLLAYKRSYNIKL